MLENKEVVQPQESPKTRVKYATYAEAMTHLSEHPLNVGLIGSALEALKNGHAIARTGWNGKDMFVYMVPADSYAATTGVEKAYFGPDAAVPYSAHLAIKNTDDTVSTWVPSVNDCMANDWILVDVAKLREKRNKQVNNNG